MRQRNKSILDLKTIQIVLYFWISNIPSLIIATMYLRISYTLRFRWNEKWLKCWNVDDDGWKEAYDLYIEGFYFPLFARSSSFDVDKYARVSTVHCWER